MTIQTLKCHKALWTSATYILGSQNRSKHITYFLNRNKKKNWQGRKQSKIKKTQNQESKIKRKENKMTEENMMQNQNKKTRINYKEWMQGKKNKM